MLHIGLNLPDGRGWIGGCEYIKNIIKALGTLSGSVRATFRLTVLSHDQIDPFLLKDIADLPAYRQCVPANDLGITERWRNRLGRRLFGMDLPMTVATAGRAGIRFLYPQSRFPLMPGSLRCAAWIEDFQHKHYPEYFSADERVARDELHRQVTRHSRTIVVSSQTAQSDLERFCPSAAKRSQVLSFRSVPGDEWFAGDGKAVVESYRVPERFFIVCNQFWKHKNHGVVFQALAKLQQKKIYPHVVCTGPLRDHRNPSHPQEMQRLIRDLGIENQVSLLGLLPRIDQVQLLRRALAIAQPSLFEGWSSVVEDGRALGKPILLSDIPVHREQIPSRAVFFHPLSVDELADAMGHAWQTLEAGPDPAAEGEARLAQSELVRSFAEQFLQLARTAA